MTIEEARLTLQDNFGYLSQEHPRILEALRVALDALSQPSLPSILNEAAEAHRRKVYSGDPEMSQFVREVFKAGAEWMAGQGCSFETIMQEDDVDELVPTCPDMYNHGYSCGDKVIVQIRNKQLPGEA